VRTTASGSPPLAGTRRISDGSPFQVAMVWMKYTNRPSADHAGQWVCQPPRADTSSRGFSPFASATTIASPRLSPGRT
jgi:hypothetical protein